MNQITNTAEIIDITALGKALTLISQEVITLDAAKARWMLEDLQQFPNERPLRDSHVRYLAAQMERGSFLPEQVRLIVCEYNGVLHRMNGQHTSWAVYELAESEPVSFEVTLMTYRAATEHDMRRLYASIDRGAPRTKGHVVHSYLGGTEEFGKLNGKQLQQLSTGFQTWKWPMKHDQRQHGGDDIATLMLTEALDVSLRVRDFIMGLSQREHGHVLRGGVVAAMFATFSKAPRISHEFWSVVSRGVGIDSEDDPRHKLRVFLTNATIRVGTGRGDKRAVSSEDMYRVSIAAWNAHRENRTMRYFKPGAYKERSRAK